MDLKYPVPLDGRCPYCNTVDLCPCVTPNTAEIFANMDIQKAATMRLTGEDKVFTTEYQRCLERINARQRIADRRNSRTKQQAAGS